MGVVTTRPAPKPALFFIHGFPFNQTMWKAQVALTAGRFLPIAYDLRGHGSNPAGTGQYHFEQFIDDLIEMLDKKGISKAVMCGLSMGGYVALRALERAPERISGLILCDTRSEADSNEAKVKRSASIKTIQNQGVSTFCESFLKAVLAPETYTGKPAIVEQVRQMIMGNSATGIIAALLALAGRTDTTESLARIKVPTLILVGEKDGVTPPTASEAMHQRIPGSQLAIIPHAGHLSNLENPEIFNRHLMDFLTQTTFPL
jgi:pimeloyl-ACP methyl ester carboxylesterase